MATGFNPTSFFSTHNWVDAPSAVVTGDAEAGDLVAAHLQQRGSYRVWRTEGLSVSDTAAGFLVDFGRVREVGVLALCFPRTSSPYDYDLQPDFGAADTIRHRLDAATPGAGALHDSGVVASGVLPGYGVHVHRLTAPVSARYWRCDLDAVSRANLGYVDVQRAWAGPVFEPAIGFAWGDTVIWDSDSVIARASRGPSEFVEPQESIRTWAMSFEGLSDEESAQMVELERRMTTAGQFLAHRTDQPAGMRAMLCRQASATGVASATHRISKKQMRLLEAP